MAVWSEVTLSELQYSRLDGEFYSPKYIQEDEVWRRFSAKHNIEKLGRLISVPVRTGSTPKNRFVGKNDNTIHFVKTNTLREGRIDYPNCDFLPERVLRKSDFIPNEAVLVTIIGATPEIVGRTAIVRDSDPERVTNQNVAVIQTNNKLDAYYLTAYFQTKYGRDQLWRHSRRTEQVNLNCREVERVLVPFIELQEQRQIGELVRKSFSTLDLSKSLYVQAQELLAKELGLDKLVLDRPKSYETSFSEVVSCGRIDSDHFQYRYQQLKELIKNYIGGYLPLLSIVCSITPNIEPSKSPLESYSYVELSNINSSLGIIERAKTLLGKDAPSRAKRYVSTGDIIASAVVGSVDKAGIVDEQRDGSLASTGFFHFRSKGVEPEYLLILIRSLIVREQLLQEATGGILSAVPDSKLRNLIVPNIPIELQTEIASLVKQSHEAKKESEQLLDQAKKMVEELIEGAV